MTQFYDANEAWQAGHRLDPEDSVPMTAPQDTGSKGNGEGWEPPVSFHEFDVPVFPLAVLPRVIREYVEAEAQATQTPIDLAAMLCLVTVSATVAGKVRVSVKPGWTEPVNLYTAVALGPGNRKSQVCRDTVRPLEEHERTEAERMAPMIAEARAQRDLLEKRLEEAKRQAVKGKGNQRQDAELEVKDLAEQLADFEVPASPRYILDDVTTEKLAVVVQEQGGRIAVMSAEGGGPFELMAGRYAKNGSPNFEVYLKGHAGDPLRVDRIGRPPVFVAHPTVTVGLALQPDVIRSLADKPGFRGRGLLGRFLYSMPKSPVGHRRIDPPTVPGGTRHRYESMIRSLLAMHANRGPEGQARPHELTLTQEARRLLFAFMRELEPKLADGSELGIISDWAGKLAGAVVRIGGLFHMAEHADHQAPWEVPVEGCTLHDAVGLGEYLVPHAQAAFAEMGADPDVESARHVLAWIQRGDLARFSKRDAFNALRGRFKTVTELEPALSQLTERGYIRLRSAAERGGPGRPPSPIFDVNPHTHNPQNTQNRPARPHSAETAYCAGTTPC